MSQQRKNKNYYAAEAKNSLCDDTNNQGDKKVILQDIREETRAKRSVRCVYDPIFKNKYFDNIQSMQIWGGGACRLILNIVLFHTPSYRVSVELIHFA